MKSEKGTKRSRSGLKIVLKTFLRMARGKRIAARIKFTKFATIAEPLARIHSFFFQFMINKIIATIKITKFVTIYEIRYDR